MKKERSKLIFEEVVGLCSVSLGGNGQKLLARTPDPHVKSP